MSRSVKYCTLLFISMLLLSLSFFSQHVKADISFDGTTDYNGDGFMDPTIDNGRIRISFMTEERLGNPPGQQITYFPTFFLWDGNDWAEIATLGHFQVSIAPNTSQSPVSSYTIKENDPKQVDLSWEKFYQRGVTITDAYGHSWQVTDYYTLRDGWDYVEIERHWEHLNDSVEEAVLLPFNVSITHPEAVSPRKADALTMPGSFYNGNLYDLNTADRQVTPDFPMTDLTNQSQYLIVEQERLSIPSVIWEYDDFVCGLLTTPTYVCDGQEYTGNSSLGYQGNADHFDLINYLGGWTSGGSSREGYAYTKHINQQINQDNPGCRDQYEWTFNKHSLTVDANTTLKKTYRLYLGTTATPNYGFIEPVQLGWDWISSNYSAVNPTLSMQEILQLKAELAYHTFYHQNNTDHEYLFLAGFFSDGTPVEFLGGSCGSMGGQLGQQHALAYALLYYGYQTGNTSMITTANNIIDEFVDLSRNPSAVTLDEYGWLLPDYYLETNISYANARDHGGDVHTVKSGEVLYNLLQCYLLAEQYGDSHPDWLAYVEAAINIFVVKQFANGTFGNTWTNGISSSCNDIAGCGGVTLALSLIELATLTGNTTYSEAATLAMNYYITEFVDKARFFGVDTGRYDFNYGYKKHIIDSKTAEYMLKTLLRFYEITNISIYLTKANLTAEWLITWQYAWNVPLTASSRLGDHNFKTKGAFATSVELNALRPAYGSSYALQKLASYLSDAELQNRADLVNAASRQMVATSSDTLGMSNDLAGSQETYWYHGSFTEDTNSPQGGSSGLCYGITIADAYMGTNISLETDNPDDPTDGNSGSNEGEGSNNDSSNDSGDNSGGDSSAETAALIVTISLENGTRFNSNSKKEIFVTVSNDQGAPIEQAHVTITLNANKTLECQEIEPGIYKTILITSELTPGEYLLIVKVEKSGYRTSQLEYNLTVVKGLNFTTISLGVRIGAVSGIGLMLTIIGKRKLFDDITLDL